MQVRQVEWHYIAPGRPQQNAFVESFNGRQPFHRSLRSQRRGTRRGGGADSGCPGAVVCQAVQRHGEVSVRQELQPKVSDSGAHRQAVPRTASASSLTFPDADHREASPPSRHLVDIDISDCTLGMIRGATLDARRTTACTRHQCPTGHRSNFVVNGDERCWRRLALLRQSCWIHPFSGWTSKQPLPNMTTAGPLQARLWPTLSSWTRSRAQRVICTTFSPEGRATSAEELVTRSRRG
ncbi:hypothetical protein D9599_29720 [Roseomonas sp. KE2513]|nr:hypothetical protein [Roseomonas sp. KE2513]